jgi:hypothetical protein
MFDDSMNKKALIATPLIAAWGFNTYFLSLSRSGTTLIKLSAIIFMGPFTTFINATGPLYNNFTVTGLSIALIIGIYFCVRKVSLLKSIVAFFLFFCWFFIAVLYLEIEE